MRMYPLILVMLVGCGSVIFCVGKSVFHFIVHLFNCVEGTRVA